MSTLTDKTGREIMVGDVLKIFHFTHYLRREKCYMYKHVIAREMLGATNPVPAFKISHLELRETGYYRELIDGRQLNDVEIVQGYDTDGVCYRDRPRAARPDAPLPSAAARTPTANGEGKF